MRFLSLFSGIGGIDLGLERAGMTCVGQVEIDPYCRAVLAKHWPDVPRYDDVRTREYREGEADVVAGGFPCQDISNAGLCAGITGERSGLWRELVRAVRVVRPLYAIVENVAALLVRGMGRVLGDLAESGYDAEWDCLPACAVGAPHIRNRVFIIGTPNDVAHPMRARLEGIHPAGWGEHLQSTTTDISRLVWKSSPEVCRRGHGVPYRIHRVRGLGSAIMEAAALSAKAEAR